MYKHAGLIFFCSILMISEASAQNHHGPLTTPPPHSHQVKRAGEAVHVNDVPAGKFRDQLTKLPPAAQAEALKTLEKLTFHVSDYASLRSDKEGGVYYVCEETPSSPQGEAITQAAAQDPAQKGEPLAESASVAVANPPAYSSKPGAPYVIYLDFNGGLVEGTSWTEGSATNWNTRAWSSDGDESTFTDSEQNIMSQVWSRISEDYSPFNVNVTTDVTYDPDNYTGDKDKVGWLLFTPTNDVNNVGCPHTDSGGVAYVGVFGDAIYSPSRQPAWVTPASSANMAEAASHEMGHNMGLSHDGKGASTYYGGHSTSNGVSPSWGPIMGTGYGRDVSQWSKGEYVDSTQPQDDLAIISARVPYRTDDHGNDNGSATVISPAGDGSFELQGLIETTSEADVFTFSTGAGAVTLNATTFTAASSTRGCNLDILMELYNTSSTLLATNNPAQTTDASISTNLPAGTYFVYIRPTGAGDPLSSPLSGYTVYGSIGQYTLSGSCVLPGVSVSQSSNTTDVVEGGATDVYTLSLGTAPTSTVTITISSDSQVNTSSNTVIFTPSTWNTPQNITVSAVDDSAEEGPHTGIISHSSSSLDPAFNGIGVASVIVNITDNDDIVLTAPNGNEKWVAGETNTITWISLMGGNVKIDLLKNGLFSAVITNSTANNGSFNWALPSNQSPATNYQVRVTSVETSSVMDSSDNTFSILPAPAAFYVADMDSDPGWTLDTGWEYGIPTGQGQDAYGGPDPTSGFNGPKVIGYNLAGDYDINIPATRWATTPAIDCSNHQNIKLNFQRWLGIEEFNWDKVYVEVSKDGSNWSLLYSNPTSSRVDDQAWTNVEYDVSYVADGQSTVYIRWGLGTTDGSWNWCGWNLDEVKLIGSPLTAPTGITITESSNSTDVAEGGGNDSYTIVLDSEPTDTVTITVSPDNEVNVSSTNVVFTTNNWNLAQTITVTAVDDSDHEFLHTGGITHTSSSADNDYNNVSIDGVVVNITDNDNNAPTVDAGPDQVISLTGGTWLPTDVGVALWLDADDAATIQTNGSTVSTWQDKSGNSRNATQGVSGSQPTLTAAGLNGKSTLTFDGSADYLNVDLDFLAGTAHSAFVVTKPTIYSDIYGAANGSAGSNSLHVGFSNSSTYRMNYWGNDYNGTIKTNYQAAQANLLNYIWITGSAKQVYANGGYEGTAGPVAGTIGPMAGGGRIGRVVNHPFYGGDIAEFIIVTGTVAQATRELFEGYLAHKWGTESFLPPSHTYKTNSPSGASAIANLNGTVNDSDGDALTTQWALVSGPASVDIGDTNAVDTTATFTTEGVYVLSLTANDGYGPVSNTVTITVGSAGADLDSDGMADAWETTHSLTDPNGDEDGDGATNYEEYMAGTDPNDPSKVLRIISITVNGSGQPVIQWQSDQDGTAPTRQYKVLRNPALLGGTWSETANGIPSAGATTQHTDVSAPQTNSFYRIEPY